MLMGKSMEWHKTTVFDPAERVNVRGVANLTQVLDNWRFDIMRKVQEILQNDHQSVLPDYARYQQHHGGVMSWSFPEHP